MASRIRVSNRGRLKSRIPAIIDELPPHIDVGMREAAVAIAEIAKALCPVGDPVVHLRDAIHVERRIDSTTSGKVRLTWRVVAWSSKAWYGHMVEWGTVHTGLERPHVRGWGREMESKGRALWTVPPHPFMTPAAEIGRAGFNERINKAIRDACE